LLSLDEVKTLSEDKDILEAFMFSYNPYKDKDRSTMLGFFGELTVALSLMKVFKPHTVKDLTSKRQGVDYIINYRGEKILLEVKNWAHYVVSKSLFEKKILSRFIRSDPKHEHHWVLAINSFIAKELYFKKLCKEHKIFILPILHHMTLETSELMNIAAEDLAKDIKNMLKGLLFLVYRCFYVGRVWRLRQFIGELVFRGLKVAYFSISEQRCWFVVNNERNGSTYVVTLTREKAYCSCPHAIYRQALCKHIKFVLQFLVLYDPFLAAQFSEVCGVKI